MFIFQQLCLQVGWHVHFPTAVSTGRVACSLFVFQRVQFNLALLRLHINSHNGSKFNIKFSRKNEWFHRYAGPIVSGLITFLIILCI